MTDDEWGLQKQLRIAERNRRMFMQGYRKGYARARPGPWSRILVAAFTALIVSLLVSTCSVGR